MTKTYQASTQLGFALPVWAVPAVPAAAVRTLPLMGGVSAVRDGAFPGTSAWSPPI